MCSTARLPTSRAGLGIIVIGCQGIRVCRVLSGSRVWRSSKGPTAVDRLQSRSMYGRTRV